MKNLRKSRVDDPVSWSYRKLTLTNGIMNSLRFLLDARKAENHLTTVKEPLWGAIYLRSQPLHAIPLAGLETMPGASTLVTIQEYSLPEKSPEFHKAPPLLTRTPKDDPHTWSCLAGPGCAELLHSTYLRFAPTYTPHSQNPQKRDHDLISVLTRGSA